MMRLPRRFLTLLFVTMVLLLASGVYFHSAHQQRIQHEVEEQLQAIAQLKVGQITEWRRERLSDGVMLMESPFLVEGVAQWMAAPQVEKTEQLLARFGALQEHNHYRDVILVEAGGKVRLSLSGGPACLHEQALRALAEALRVRRPVLSEVHAGPGDLPPHLDVVAPLFPADEKAREAVGVVILQCATQRFLFPLVESWPTPSRTAETLLVRRDGDDVLFLSELRHQSDAALKLRIPLRRDDMPAVMAVQGRKGIVRGHDYRGVEVLSVLKAVPDSPWFMIAKVDTAEAFAPWRLQSALILAVTFLAVTLVVVIVFGAAQREAKAHWHALFQAEAAQRRIEQRYRVTLISIGEGVVVTDAEGRVELLNPVAQGLTGWTDEEARGQPLETVSCIVNEETRAPIGPVLREGVVVGQAQHAVLVARDGTERPIAVAGAPIRDEDGAVRGAVLVFQDQTEERRAERTLRDSEQRFRDLANLLPQTIYEIDLEGRLTFVNRQALKVFGYTWAEFEAGLSCFEMVVASERDRARQNMQRILHGEDARGAEYIAQRRDGMQFPVVIYSSPILRGDAPVGLRGIIVDVTEKKEDENKLASLQVQLTHTSRLATLGELAAGVAHELNQPLCTIVNFAKACKNNASQPAPDWSQIRQWSDAIARAAAHSGDIVRRLLGFARRSEGRHAAVAVRQLVDEALLLVRYEAQTQKVAIRQELPDQGLTVWADPAQIQQVLMNLLRNSIEALVDTPPRDRRIVVQAGPADGMVQVSVSDNGPGRPVAELPQMFEPFFTTKPQGLGLGLPISKTIIEDHGGRIWAETNEDGGLKMHFTLPSGKDKPQDVPGQNGVRDR
jgi:PAS domain S-box-containing protein